MKQWNAPRDAGIKYTLTTFNHDHWGTLLAFFYNRFYLVLFAVCGQKKFKAK